MSSTHDPTAGWQEAGRTARVLELAVQNAERLLAEARTEAEQLRADALEDADAILAAARQEAERVRAALEESRALIDADITRLRLSQQQHRARLREHLHAVLAPGDEPAPSELPPRATEVG
jgi:cell division septum initiation protein DivIVA